MKSVDDKSDPPARWRTVLPLTASGSERERFRLTRFTFLTHLRPTRLPAGTLRWSLTMGLGGSSLVLLILLLFSGLLQMLVYVPVPEQAHAQVTALQQEITFGALVRGIHYWSANLLILVALLHTARVFLTGGFCGPRAWTWVLGVVLLLGILASAFTGYLLPWDQRAYWAVTIVTGMFEYAPVIGPILQRVIRGGTEIGGDTLVLFFTLHTSILPVLLAGLAGWHFWRVRRAGGVIEPPPAGGNEGPPSPQIAFLPHLFVRELAQGLILIAVVVALSTIWGAPLGEAANPGMSPNPAKAPWYFIGFQELLIHLHPTFAVLVLPLLSLIGWILLPYFVPEITDGGRWFLSRTGRRAAALAAAIALVATPALVLLRENFGSGATGWLVGGLLPLAGLTGGAAGLFWLLRRRWNARPEESVQAVVVLLGVGFVVLTLIGQWLRGPGMQLVWPL